MSERLSSFSVPPSFFLHCIAHHGGLGGVAFALVAFGIDLEDRVGGYVVVVEVSFGEWTEIHRLCGREHHYDGVLITAV